MDNNKKKLIAYFVVGGMILVGSRIGMATNSQPGSEGDPLVTQGYVEKKIDQIKYYVDTKIASMPSGGSTEKLEVVSVPKGKKLVGFEGTTMILRSGSAVAVDSAAGGIANLTAGADMKKNEQIRANHQLLIPRNDGRGMEAVTDIIVLVRGRYTIE